MRNRPMVFLRLEFQENRPASVPRRTGFHRMPKDSADYVSYGVMSIPGYLALTPAMVSSVQ